MEDCEWPEKKCGSVWTGAGPDLMSEGLKRKTIGVV